MLLSLVASYFSGPIFSSFKIPQNTELIIRQEVIKRCRDWVWVIVGGIVGGAVLVLMLYKETQNAHEIMDRPGKYFIGISRPHL
jgi:formate/nitrite transporter FocA (FNT family)